MTLELEDLETEVKSGAIDTVMVAFTDHFGRLMGKRFDAEFFLEDTVGHGTHGCDYLLTVDMDMEPVEGYSAANWDKGYGDFHLVPDMTTLRRAAWTERTALVLCDVRADDGTGVEAPLPISPRNLLQRQVDRLATAGLSAKAASELEFFVFDEPYRTAAEISHQKLTTAGWYNEDYHLLQGARHEPFVGAARRALKGSGIPVENTKGEAALGQHELNIRYADVLTMADRHVVMKHAMKELADQLGISCTFMAKPVAGQSGNSCHLHLSVWSDEDSNAFVSGDERSQLFGSFLAGWMERVPELMVLYAPTINSYKRYQSASWAPTRIAWSSDNRTAGFRVVGHGSSTRIECRIPGGDINPYLAYAAALASGLDGIERGLEPPPEYRGDVYSATDVPLVARSLEAALPAFKESAFARETFGDDVVDHYAHFFATELDAWHRAVTDWEHTRYFERI